MKSIITSFIILSTYFGFAQKDTFKAKVYTYSFNNRSYLDFGWEEIYNEDGRIIKKLYTQNLTSEGFVPNVQYFYKDSLLTLTLNSVESNKIAKVSYEYNKKGKCIKETSFDFRLRPINERTAKHTIKGDSILSWKKQFEIIYKYDKKGNRILKTEKHGKVKTIKYTYAYDSINRIIEEKEYRSKKLYVLIKYQYNDSGYLKKYNQTIHHCYTKKFENTVSFIYIDDSKRKHETKTIYDNLGRIIEIVIDGYGRVWVYE